MEDRKKVIQDFFKLHRKGVVQIPHVTEGVVIEKADEIYSSLIESEIVPQILNIPNFKTHSAFVSSFVIEKN